MKKTILAALIALSLGACTDADNARRTLDAAGFSDIKIGGYAWLACSKGDQLHTSFTAVGPTGKAVSGVVCEGAFKGSTIRFD